MRALLQYIRPQKIPNKARAPSGPRALLKEFLAGVYTVTTPEHKVFITIIKTAPLVLKKWTIYFCKVTKSSGPPYWITVSNVVTSSISFVRNSGNIRNTPAGVYRIITALRFHAHRCVFVLCAIPVFIM